MKNKIIKDYLLGKCTESELQELLNWINSSEQNAAEFFQLEKLYFAGKSDVKIDNAKIMSADSRLKNRISGIRKANSFKKIFSYAAIAACFTIGIVLGTFKFLQKPQMILAEATNEVTTITLPDNSKVWLNDNSKLEYPKTFSSEQREVKLIGEAYFEITPDEHTPFIVQSNGMKVKVLGTVFNFNARNAENEEVTLIKGKIQVSGNNDEGKITLSPGQKVILDRKQVSLTVEQVHSAELDAVWHDKMIPFRNANIKEICEVLERFYNVRIYVSPTVNGKITYSGLIEQSNSIESVLEALAYSIPMSYTILDNNIYIGKK